MITTTTVNLVELKSKLFNGFADPSRLSILQTLVDGPRNVGEIVEATGLSQPNTSNHLNCLHDCGLVVREKRGRSVYYQLSDKRIATLLTLAGEILADSARGVYECTRYQITMKPVDR
jgi:ArsR family transcriptional regulator, cadmium/lead-responsive transcriptional repressor